MKELLFFLFEKFNYNKFALRVFAVMSTSPMIAFHSLAATTTSDILPWPNGVIPYMIEDDIPTDIQQNIQKAIDRIHRLKIVKFIPQNPSDLSLSSLVFTHQSSSMCSSSYGWKDETSTLIKVSTDCTYGNILHEILHALGLVHEQLNPQKQFPINFNVLATAWSDQYFFENTVALTEHDPYSIMHYHSKDNSICTRINDPKWKSQPKELLPHDTCRVLNWIDFRAANNGGIDCWLECAVFLHPTLGMFGGQREDLSELDIQGLRTLYHKVLPSLSQKLKQISYFINNFNSL